MVDGCLLPGGVQLYSQPVRPVQVNSRPEQPAREPIITSIIPVRDMDIYEIQNSLFMTAFLNFLSLNRFLMLTFYS